MNRSRLTRALIVRTGSLLCALVLTAFGVLGAAGAPFGAVPAQAATPSPSPTPAGAVVVQVTSVQPQVLRPTDNLVVTASVTNNTASPLNNPRAVLRVSRYRLTSSAQLATWASSAQSADAGAVVGSVDVPGPLAPGASVQVTVTEPATAFGLLVAPDAWGPRGLALELTNNGKRVGLDRTFLLWLPYDTAPVSQVSVLVPIVGPAPDTVPTAAPTPAPSSTGATAGTSTKTGTSTHGTSVSARALGALTGPTGRLRSVIDATRTHGEVSWAVDPSLVDAAGAGGPSTVAWLNDLTKGSAQRDVFALPWGDPDLAAIAHADQPGLLQVAKSEAASSAAAIFGASPRTDLMWAADDVPDLRTATLAAQAGAHELVVGPHALAPNGKVSSTRSGTATVSTPSGALTALVPDAALSADLAGAQAVDPGVTPAIPVTPATAAQRILAETAVATHQTTSVPQHLLATLPRSWSPDVQTVQAQLDALATAPWTQLVPVTDLINRNVDDVARTPLPASARSTQELSPAQVVQLGAARSAVAAFATVVPQPDALLAGLDREILGPLAVAARDVPAARSTLVSAVLADATTRRSGLSVLVSPRFNVIASATQIRLTVHNDLSESATVRVDLRPRKACLTVTGAPTSTTVDAKTDQTVAVPVLANANCDVVVDVVLLAPDGTVVATPAQFDARLTPTIENVGTAIVGALLALGLVVGIVRTVRRGQTANRGARVSTPAPAGAPADAAGPGDGAIDGVADGVIHRVPEDPR
jgi:hypothetical protein